jgi:tetratricopeptide (TPR) repeat protein
MSEPLPEQFERLKSALADRYTLERELGAGGMATVYLARDPKHHRNVAIKVLKPELAAEIAIAAQLNHPHILPLYDSGEAEGFLYYVMPYVEGQTLRQRLLKERELPVAEAVRIIRDVVDALTEAHAHGVVHRDIKPENVLLRGRHALVMDFGVAKAVSDATGLKQLTTAGVSLGTPAYMAPEQATADPRLDHRVDIYAVGVVAYELLTGRQPIQGATAQQVLAAHVTSLPQPVTQYREAVPPELAGTVMRCLEKKPADRVQSAEELLQHIEALSTSTGGITPAMTRPVAAVDDQATARWAHPLRVAGMFGLASVGALAIVYGMMQQLGLASWVFPAAIGLLALGLPIMLFTGHHERRRAEARMAGVPTATPAGVARHFTWRRSLAGGGLAFLGLAIASASYMATRLLGIGPAATLVSSGVFEQRERIVLASFDNSTADSALGETVTELFRIDLAQSPTVTIMESAQLAAVLARMERAPDARIGRELALEIAQREGIKAVVIGQIRELGTALVLSARLLAVSSGDALWAGSERAADVDGVFAAIDRLSAAVRERIGESLRTIRRDPPLARATTRSTEALRLYAQALRANDLGDPQRAIALLEQSIATDSNFAMAYRKLGVVLTNFERDAERADSAFARAYRLRDRLTERERYLADGAYERYVTRDYQAAIAIYRSLLDKYPTDQTALNNLAVRYQRLGRLDEAAELLTRSISLGHAPSVTFKNAVEVLYMLGAVDSAAQLLEQFAREHPRNPRMMLLRSDFASAQGDYDAAVDYAEALMDAHRGNPTWDREVSLALAHLARVRGRMAEARMHVDDAQDKAWEIGLPFTEEVPRSVLDAAERADYQLWFRGDASGARAIKDSILVGDWFASRPPPERDYLALAEFYARAGDIVRAKELLGRFETEIDAEDRGREEHRWYHARAMIAVADERFDDAVAALRRWADHEDNEAFPFFELFDLAQAYDAAGEADSAITYYRRYLNQPFIYRLGSDSDNLWLVLRRLGALHQARGDQAAALEHYERFVELWREADRELQPLVREVSDRVARLAG